MMGESICERVSIVPARFAPARFAPSNFSEKNCLPCVPPPSCLQQRCSGNPGVKDLINPGVFCNRLYSTQNGGGRCRSAAVSEVESFAPATIAIPAEITGENPDWNPP